MSLKFLHARSIEALKYLCTENEQLKKQISEIESPPPSFTEEDRKKLESDIEQKYIFKIRDVYNIIYSSKQLNKDIMKLKDEMSYLKDDITKIQEANSLLTIRNQAMEKERKETLKVKLTIIITTIQIIAERDSTIKQKDTEILELTSDTYKLSKRIGTTLDPDNVTLKVQLEKQKSIQADLEKQIQSLENTMKVKLQDKEDIIGVLRRDIKKMQDNDKGKEVDQLAKTVAAQKEQIENLTKQKKQLELIKTDFMNSTSTLKQRVNEAEAKVKLYESEMKPLKEKLEFYAKNEDQFKRFVEMRKEVTALKQKVAKLEKERKLVKQKQVSLPDSVK